MAGYISCSRSPTSFALQAAEKQWTRPLSVNSVPGRGSMAAQGWQYSFLEKYRGLVSEVECGRKQCQPSLIYHHPAGEGATEHKTRPTLKVKMSPKTIKPKGITQLRMPEIVQFSLLTAVIIFKMLFNHYWLNISTKDRYNQEIC